MKTLLLGLLLCGVCWAQNLRIVDVQPFTVKNTPIIAPNGNSPVLIDTGSSQWYTLTVADGGLSYSANFRETKHLRPSAWIVGDLLPVTIANDHLIVKDDRGKEIKARIVRRARTTEQPASPTSASR